MRKRTAFEKIKIFIFYYIFRLISIKITELESEKHLRISEAIETIFMELFCKLSKKNYTQTFTILRNIMWPNGFDGLNAPN